MIGSIYTLKDPRTELNIRKSKLANRYEILENKNKFDVKSKNDKKKK